MTEREKELLAALKRANYLLIGQDYLDAAAIIREAIDKAEKSLELPKTWRSEP